MKLSHKGELSLLREIRSRFPSMGGHLVGIGDDAAVIGRHCGGSQAVTTDMMVEGVHFDLAYTGPEDLGFKLASVNASDIYAMGGKPAYLLVAMALPVATDTAFVNAFLKGIALALGTYGMKLIGGDTTASKCGIALSATAIGYATKPILRSGARPGQGIYVTGTLGDSACGLRLLKGGKPARLGSKAYDHLCQRHLRPLARKPGRLLRDATAMMDISDGLVIDLGRLAEESSVSATVYEYRLPLSGELLEAASALGIDPVELALTGGEDYELLFTAPRGLRLRGATEIGEASAGDGISVLGPDGRRRKLSCMGYEHFRAVKGQGG